MQLCPRFMIGLSLCLDGCKCMMSPSRCRTTQLFQPWPENAPGTYTVESSAAAFGLPYVAYPSRHQDFHSLRCCLPAAQLLLPGMHLEVSRLLLGQCFRKRALARELQGLSRLLFCLVSARIVRKLWQSEMDLGARRGHHPSFLDLYFIPYNFNLVTSGNKTLCFCQKAHNKLIIAEKPYNFHFLS